MNANVAANTSIDSIQAPQGMIGSSSAVTITATGSFVGEVTAKSGIQANITAATGLKYLEVTDANSTFGTRGTINCPKLLDRSTTEGGLIRSPGYYRMVTTLTDGLPANASIQVARLGQETGDSGTTDLNQPIIILGSGGANDLRLSGQIVVNAYNNVTPESNGTSQAWIGRVNVRKPSSVTVSLGPTTSTYLTSFKGEYPDTGASLGQTTGTGAGFGAVGIASYFVHGTDSPLAFTLGSSAKTFIEAAPNAVVSKKYRSGNESANWIIRLYGPSTVRDESAPDAFVIERQDCGSSTWTNVSSSFVPSITGRVATIQTVSAMQFSLDSKFRIRPLRTGSGPVTCDLVTGAPVVADDLVQFVVDTPVPGDINLDCTTNTSDLTLLLVYYGQTIAGCSSVGDLNRDGAVDTADLTLLLAGFGQSCSSEELLAPPTAPGASGVIRATGVEHTGSPMASMPSGAGDEGGAPSNQAQAPVSTPPGPVLSALGFESAEAYQAWVSTLNDDELWNHIKHVLEVIHALGLD